MDETVKSKEQVMAERKAKKAAKQGKKNCSTVEPKQAGDSSQAGSSVSKGKPQAVVAVEKCDQAKSGNLSQDKPNPKSSTTKPKEAVDSKRSAPSKPEAKPQNAVTLEKLDQITIASSDLSLETKPSMTKAERRAKQEAQRAEKAKQEAQRAEKAKPVVEKKIAKEKVVVKKAKEPTTEPSPVDSSVMGIHKVKLFKHLYSDKCNFNINVNQKLHPAIVKLGLHFANDAIVGSNARCYAFLHAMQILIKDYEAPPEKHFTRGLESSIQPAVDFLNNCRPISVSITNALKYIKVCISQENSTDSDEKIKQRLIEKINTYADDQIETAAISISLKVREKISNGDVILTYGCSSLIRRTLDEASKQSDRKFRVIVVDSRPDHEGQEMLKSLTMLGIDCTYVLINAISFIMPEVTKVIISAHAILANGFVMSRIGSAQIALVARSCNVPVLVCCETHKFSERVQTDAFVFNELGDPSALIINKNTRECSDYLKGWQKVSYFTPLNLRYDITPPELVTAVVTEVAILPCTSVQVILRVKPAE